MVAKTPMATMTTVSMAPRRVQALCCISAPAAPAVGWGPPEMDAVGLWGSRGQLRTPGRFLWDPQTNSSGDLEDTKTGLYGEPQNPSLWGSKGPQDQFPWGPLQPITTGLWRTAGVVPIGNPKSHPYGNPQNPSPRGSGEPQNWLLWGIPKLVPVGLWVTPVQVSMGNP